MLIDAKRDSLRKEVVLGACETHPIQFVNDTDSGLIEIFDIESSQTGLPLVVIVST